MAASRFVALGLSRPSLASMAWFSDQGMAEQRTYFPMRRLICIGRSTNDPNIDLVAELAAIPFRDHQFRLVALNTGCFPVTKVEDADQLYRVLQEHALLILVGTGKENRQTERNLFGLFRKRQTVEARIFAKRYAQWPMQRPSSIANAQDLTASLAMRLFSLLAIGKARPLEVSIMDKVTPPPPVPGLYQTIKEPVTSAMPTGSLATSTKSRFCAGRS